MELPIYQVDAFAGQLFSGNPAAVVFCDDELPAATMQSIAAENNLSETAFVVPVGGRHAIRWFTPAVEVDLCGHATLAAAHVMFRHRDFAADTVSFDSRSGALSVRRDDDLLFLQFPAYPVTVMELDAELISALGGEPAELYRGRDDVLAVYPSEDLVAALCPNLARLSDVNARGVIVSAPGDQVDFVSRFFAPRCGVPEDPVTGSAHTVLTPYWCERLGKQTLQARQISTRGGELICKSLGERVEIGGRAVSYLVGTITL